MIQQSLPEDVARFLSSFESLAPAERRMALTELLRRNSELAEGPLNDDHLTELADELFQALDAEETDADRAGTGCCGG